MSVLGGDIFLGDLARTLAVLGAERALQWDDIRTIAARLGLTLDEQQAPAPRPTPGSWAATQTSAQPTRPEPEQRSQEVPQTTERMPPESARRELWAPESPAAETGGNDAGFSMEQVAAELPAAPSDDHMGDAAEADPDADSATPTGCPPTLPSLLQPILTRAIMTRSLRVAAVGDEPDLDAMAEALARLDDPGRVPALMEWRLAHHCQLLVDRGDGMRPYRRDMRDFHWQLVKVAGDDRVELLHFRECPTLGVETPDELEPMPYRPPEQTPVIVLTDLGIAKSFAGVDAAAIKHWLAFAEVLDAADSPLLVWVPHARERWPRPLADSLPLLAWDRVTDTRSVEQVLG